MLSPLRRCSDTAVLPLQHAEADHRISADAQGAVRDAASRDEFVVRRRAARQVFEDINLAGGKQMLAAITLKAVGMIGSGVTSLASCIPS